jgi:hypothetical protein
MERQSFTREQEEWLCYLIGEWYLFWKGKICDKNGTHSLGKAKEHLKAIICNDEELFRSTFPFYVFKEKD